MDRVSSSSYGPGSSAALMACSRYIDSWEALSECFDELEEEKVLPSTK